MQFLMDDALPARCLLTTVVTAMAFLLAGCSVVEDLVERGAGRGRDEGDGHRQIGGAVEVDRGLVAGNQWRLVVRNHTAGPCVEIHGQRGSTGGCGQRVPEQTVIDLGIGTGPWDGGASHKFVHGAVVKNAVVVVLRFADGSELTARPRDPGPRFPFAVYVFADPQLALNGAVVLAVDRDGAELGRSSAP